jgi:acyl dehydratase
MTPLEIVPLQIATLTRQMLASYARASLDPNPIHLEDAAAKAAGLPGVIAHGMLIAGLIQERAERFRGEIASGAQMERFQIRFKAMSFPGEEIWVGGRAKEASPGVWELELQAKNNRGELKAQSQIRIR